MPIPQARDVDVDPHATDAWLPRKLPQATDVAVGEITLPSGSGFSNETLLIDAAWREGGAPVDGADWSRACSRRPTRSSRSTISTGSTARWRSSAARRRIPVPRVRWYEDDASVLGSPSTSMDRVDGVIPPDHPPFTHGGWLFDATPAAAGRARALRARRARRPAPARLARARLRLPRAPGVRRDAVRATARLLSR